jgi:hypothetical protein
VSVTIPTTPTTTVSLMSVNGWLTIFSRIDSSFPTGLEYNAYQSGFGNIASNFWFGLEKIYWLTNPNVNGQRNFRLRFELLLADDNR